MDEEVRRRERLRFSCGSSWSSSEQYQLLTALTTSGSSHALANDESDRDVLDRSPVEFVEATALGCVNTTEEVRGEDETGSEGGNGELHVVLSCTSRHGKGERAVRQQRDSYTSPSATYRSFAE